MEKSSKRSSSRAVSSHCDGSPETAVSSPAESANKLMFRPYFPPRISVYTISVSSQYVHSPCESESENQGSELPPDSDEHAEVLI